LVQKAGEFVNEFKYYGKSENAEAAIIFEWVNQSANSGLEN
jgi:hypothetical protein